MASNSSSSSNVPLFVQYTEEQRLHIKYNLEKSLGPEYVSFRAAAGGSQVIYIEGWKALNLANQIFGFNGWSSEVRSTQVDYVDNIGSKWSLGLSAVVRVTLKDGTFHEDIGYGNIENCKSRAMAFDKAKKEAVTDGVKRALRQFGNVLGNCLYEKNYLQKIKQVPKIDRNTTEDQLLRPEENIKPHFDSNGLLVKEKPLAQVLPSKKRGPNHPEQPEGPEGNIIPEDSYIEDSFLFSDEVFEEDGNGIADDEMELLLDKNTKSPPPNMRTPEPNRFIEQRQGSSQTGVTFVSTRLARDLIENAPALSPLPTNDQIAFNAQVRTPLHNKNLLDHTKSAPIKRTPLTLRKVIYDSSKKPLPEDRDQSSQQQSQEDLPPTHDLRPKDHKSPKGNEVSSRPLKQILSNNVSYDDPKSSQKRTIGLPPILNGSNKRVHRSDTR